MNYDLDFRYRRALQPDALATIATATQAVVDAMQDARNAGIALRGGMLMQARFTLRRQHPLAMLLEPLGRWFR